ncbi:MAG: NUDIX domain-containing protein [Anaerolineae bacterium]|nr:NUDIX domain-containing protein [Anaerolineae bacterium]
MRDPVQPFVTTVNTKRQFTCFPVAVLSYIINEREEFLLLAHPQRRGWWEVPNGGMEAGESLLDCALREAHEEAGPDLRLRPLGVVHAYNFHLDPQVVYMFSIGYLLAYAGGTVMPGDDMAGSRFAWFGLDDFSRDDVHVVVPPDGKYMFRRARDLYRLWRDCDDDLQPSLHESLNKYTLQEEG